MDRLLQEITPICKVFDQYIKKTGEINLFIQTAEEQKDFVENAERTPETEVFIGRLRELSNSVVLYNAAIISIYGSYELFLDEVLKSYLDYLKRRNSTYETFPEKLRTKHLSKSAEFLTNPQRFSNMGLCNEDVIMALESSYIKGQSNSLLDKLLLSHSGNLNSKQLKELLQEYGFENAIQKLSKHESFKAVCSISELTDFKRKTVFPDLDRIVEERNKVGHGWIAENRISFSLLREKYLPFVIDLCRAVKDLLVSKIIQDHMDDHYIERFDSIIHVWKDGKVIGINSKNFQLKVGEHLYFSTNDDWNYSFQIMNLQNDKYDRSEIRTPNIDISIESDKRIKDNYVIWGRTRQ